MRFTKNSLLLVLGIILYTIAITLLTNVYLENGRIITTSIAALADTKYNNDLRPSNEAKGKKTYSVENINKGNADTTINKVYTIRWNRKPFWASTEILSYKFRNCAFRNCIICESADGNPHGTCDAILFHHTEMDITVPNKTRGQTWVFMSYESEVHTLKHVLKNEWNNKMDWVISYRSDADISFPYGVLDRRQKQTYKNYTHIFLKKSRNVAWVASNCKSVSKRYQYIKEMMKTIDIDIYGKCGKKCSSSWNSDTCFKNLSKDYKFYLAFENSICDDYVSEKVFRLFQDGFNIIPVYRGARNVKDILPKDTFISSSDFETPTKLALYLKNLGSNESAYTNYLKAKDNFDSSGYTRPEIMQFMYCSVCEKLNNKYTRRSKLNLRKWLFEKKCVIPTDL